MNKISLVKFSDGTYGVRKETGIFTKRYEYLDLKNIIYWWLKGSDDYFFNHCKGTEDEARKAMADKTDIGRVIK